MKRPVHLLIGHQFIHNHGKILPVTKCERVVVDGRIKYTMRTEDVTCGKCCGNVEKKIIVANNPAGKSFLDEHLTKVSENDRWVFVPKMLKAEQIAESSRINQSAETTLVKNLQDTFNLRDDAIEPDPDETIFDSGD